VRKYCILENQTNYKNFAEFRAIIQAQTIELIIARLTFLLLILPKLILQAFYSKF